MTKAVKNSVIFWTIALILVHGIFVHEHTSAGTNTKKIASAYSTSSGGFLYTVLSVNPGTEHFNNIFVRLENTQNKHTLFLLSFILQLLTSLMAVVVIFSAKRYTHTPALIFRYPFRANNKRGPPR